MAISFPNPAGQTPANTFSPSSTPSATTNGVTYVHDGAKWVAANPGKWDRTASTLSPLNAGDAVDLGTGDLSAGAASFGGADNVSIDAANGGITFAQGGTGGQIRGVYSGSQSTSRLMFLDSTGSQKAEINGDGKGYFAGVLFGSDTADANTLDDYEEGTWTPAIVGGGGSITNVVNAKYEKIGRTVRANFYVSYNAAGANSNDLQIGGLPYAAPTDHYAAGSNLDANYGAPAGATLRVQAASDFIVALVNSANTSVVRQPVAGNQVGSGYLIGTVIYAA